MAGRSRRTQATAFGANSGANRAHQYTQGAWFDIRPCENTGTSIHIMLEPFEW